MSERSCDHTETTRGCLLLDCHGIIDELGVTKYVAERIMRKLVKVRLGSRVYVYREDVLRHVKECEVQ